MTNDSRLENILSQNKILTSESQDLYINQYVSLVSSIDRRIIAFDNDFVELIKKTKSLGYSHPHITFIKNTTKQYM